MTSLADRLTSMHALTETPLGGNSYNTIISPYVPPLFANQAVAYNCSFGSFTTAPDGTSNTAQHITEDGTTGTHYISGAYRGHTDSPYLQQRMAGIYKADTRTRICFECIQGDFGSSTRTYVGFDLAGGQIAYGPNNGGDANFLSVNAEIHPVVGFPGWYLCIFDCQFLALHVSQDVYFRTFLDNGSGTAARSTSYAGDGTSGVYGWKTSLLPTGAWAINSTALFNDFTNLNRVDVNNTKQPGYDLYFQCETWTNWQWEGGSPPLVSAIPPLGTLSIVNGTELRCQPFGRDPTFPTPPATYQYSLGFASETNGQVSAPWPQRGPAGSPPGSYVGFGFAPPYCWEYKIRMLLSHQATDGSEWDHSSMRLPQLVAVAKGNNKYITGGDIDTFDAVPYKDNEAGAQGSASELLYQSFTGTFAPGISSQINGRNQFGCFPFYLSNLALHNSGLGGGPYASGGSFYTNANGPGSTVSGPPGNPPWVPYVYGQQTVSGGPSYLDQPPITIDMENVGQTITLLHIPYNPKTKEPGSILAFFNGAFVHQMLFGYSPTIGTQLFHPCDWEEINRFFYFPSLAGSGLDCFIDWIRMMK